MKKPTISWIGAGKMGLPVCKRLRAAGHDVHVLARHPERASQLAALGFDTSASAGQLVKEADIIFTCVSDDGALADVILNGDFRSALPTGATLIDMSTVSPAISAQVAAFLPKSVAYLRAPVSGSTTMAEAGTLTTLVSGPKAAYDSLKEIFATFTKAAFHLGAAEEARYLKLAINSMVAASSALLGEALAFGMNGGLTKAAMLDVITQSVVSSPLIGYKKEMIVSGDYAPAATLNMLAKDLDLLLATAKVSNTAMPVNSIVRNIYQSALDKGLGERDFFVLVQEAEKTNGPEAA